MIDVKIRSVFSEKVAIMQMAEHILAEEVRSMTDKFITFMEEKEVVDYCIIDWSNTITIIGSGKQEINNLLTLLKIINITTIFTGIQDAIAPVLAENIDKSKIHLIFRTLTEALYYLETRQTGEMDDLIMKLQDDEGVEITQNLLESENSVDFSQIISLLEEEHE